MIVLIDNYDSFTYNLYQLIGVCNENIVVYRNDEVTVDEIEELNPSHIVISPGPGFPKDAGITIEVVKRLYRHVPILGICLGHQSICEAFGGRIVHAKQLMHGKKSAVYIANGNPIFHGLPPITEVGRYHSLIAEKESLPQDLYIIAEDEQGEIMGVKHREAMTFGLQFHPESILSKQGEQIIQNFLGVRQ